MKHVINVVATVPEVQPVGEYWVIDPTTDTVRAVFINGNLACQVFDLPKGNTERTLVPRTGG